MHAGPRGTRDGQIRFPREDREGHTMDDRQRRLATGEELSHWHSRVPPGAPGAGWFIATVFVFSVAVLGGWEWGWRETNHNIAAPTAPHRMTTGVGQSNAQ
jgi:hypothetical protein